MPRTVNCFIRGTTPAGLTVPCGAISASRSPSIRPSWLASTRPMTMPKLPGVSADRLPSTTCPAMSETCGSMAGTMPRTSAPRTVWLREMTTCPDTKGAAPVTWSWPRSFSASGCQFSGPST